MALREHSLLILDPADCGVESLIAQALQETSATLDVISTHTFGDVADLQAFLVKVYDVLRMQAELVHREHVFTRVLVNDAYKGKAGYWDAIFVNNEQMENPRALQITDCHRGSIVVYLFSTSRRKFRLDAPEGADDAAVDTTPIRSSRVSACGGTFDHLHDGHKILLTVAAFITASKLIVGVTGEALLQNKKFREYLQGYEVRKASVESFVSFAFPGLQVEVHEINDVCGPTAHVEDIDSLVLSDETAKGGDYINKVRQEKGFRRLAVHRISVVGGGSKDDNYADKLSSTKLRELEASRAQ